MAVHMHLRLPAAHSGQSAHGMDGHEAAADYQPAAAATFRHKHAKLATGRTHTNPAAAGPPRLIASVFTLSLCVSLIFLTIHTSPASGNAGAMANETVMHRRGVLAACAFERACTCMDGTNVVSCGNLGADVNWKQVGLTSIAAQTFDASPAMVRMELSWNQLAHLPPGLFDKLPYLESVFLGSNALVDLPDGLFDKNPLLTTLNLDSNKLTSISSGLFARFSTTRTMQSFRMDNNLLTTLPSNFFDGVYCGPSFGSCDFTNNPGYRPTPSGSPCNLAQRNCVGYSYVQVFSSPGCKFCFCSAGWTGAICKTPCNGGTYGAGCLQMCPSCSDGLPCNPVTGACATCPLGHYGSDCSLSCDYCQSRASCDRTTGACICPAGFTGVNCEIDAQRVSGGGGGSGSTPIAVGASVAAIAFVVACICGAFWVVRGHKNEMALRSTGESVSLTASGFENHSTANLDNVDSAPATGGSFNGKEGAQERTDACPAYEFSTEQAGGSGGAFDPTSHYN
eukprot:Opistho-2@42206